MSDAGPSHAAAFREMADKIDLNAGNGFAGAFVVVTPDGEAHDTLLLDTRANAAAFWSLLQTRAQIALTEIADAERPGQQYGRR